MTWSDILATWKADALANPWFYALGIFLWGFMAGAKVQGMLDRHFQRLQERGRYLDQRLGQLRWQLMALMRRRR